MHGHDEKQGDEQPGLSQKSIAMFEKWQPEA